MSKKHLLWAGIMITASAALFGCGKSDDETQKDNETTLIAEPQSEEEATESESQEPATDSEEPTTVTFEGDVNSISNDPVTWGVGNNVYDDNRPVAPVQLQEQYGTKYAVDFIKENEKAIYLTFDEGYENGYTPQILDVLKEKNVKAVFFVTMDYAKSEPDLIKRMIAEGHVIGSHSVTHPSKGMPSLTVEKQTGEYQELHNYIRDNFGYNMYLFRPPAGIFSEQSLAVAQKCGYRSVMWSFAYADWDPANQMEESTALEKAVGKLHNGAVYLLHAVSKTNADILGQFIDKAVQAGYEFKEYK